MTLNMHRLQRLIQMITYNMVTQKYVTLCAIWYHFYNFRNVKKNHGGVKLQSVAVIDG